MRWHFPETAFYHQRREVDGLAGWLVVATLSRMGLALLCTVPCELHRAERVTVLMPSAILSPADSFLALDSVREGTAR